MSTANTAAKAEANSQPAILKNEGDFKNKKEINMPIYNENYIFFDKTNLSNLAEVVLDHIASTLTKEGIGYTSFDWKCLILERSPEFIAIQACECCGNIRISANLGVENPYGHTHEFVAQNLGKLINDEWCEASSFSDEDGHIISLEMIVPCNGFGLLNFSTSMEEFEQKLKSFLAVASKLGLEIVIDDDAELTARSN
jgi:hypothetical protein